MSSLFSFPSRRKIHTAELTGSTAHKLMWSVRAFTFTQLLKISFALTTAARCRPNGNKNNSQLVGIQVIVWFVLPTNNSADSEKMFSKQKQKSLTLFLPASARIIIIISDSEFRSLYVRRLEFNIKCSARATSTENALCAYLDDVRSLLL